MPDTDPTEEFRLIEGFPGYRGSTLGRVQTCRRRNRNGPEIRPGRWRDLKLNRCGVRGMYRRVSLRSADGRLVHLLVHRLILTIFVGPCPEGMMCRHLDNDPTNNRLDNLAWGTALENQHDRVRHGTMHYGMKAGAARLTDDQVRELRRLRASGMTQQALAGHFGIGLTTVNNIVLNRTWKHIL